MLTAPNATVLQQRAHDSTTGGNKDCLVMLGSPAQLVLNPGFDDETEWTRATGWTIGSGVLTHAATNSGVTTQGGILVLGNVHMTVFEVTAVSSGGARMNIGSVLGTARTAVGLHAQRIGGDSATLTVLQTADTAVVSVDNINVYDLSEVIADDYPTVDALYWSFSAAPTAGNISILDASGTVFSHDITAAGPGQHLFEQGFYKTRNRPLAVVLTDPGGSPDAKLTVSYR